jgi:hypothetical protein
MLGANGEEEIDTLPGGWNRDRLHASYSAAEIFMRRPDCLIVRQVSTMKPAAAESHLE